MKKRSVWKEPHFLIGFSIFFGLLLISFVNQSVFGDTIIKKGVVYDGANIVSTPPYPPSWSHPLGTGPEGYDLLHMMIYGAKFTLSMALGVTLLRVLLSLVIGASLGMYLKKVKPFLRSFSQAFSFAPAVIICYFLMYTVLTETRLQGFIYSLPERLGFQALVITLVAVPNLIVYFIDEVERIRGLPYMNGVKVLGGGRFYIFKKHIWNELKPGLFITLGQQLLNTLVLLMHLGLLNVFLGGTKLEVSLSGSIPRSISHDWSGLIGQWLGYLDLHPWITLVPVAFFALSTMSAQFIVMGFKRVYSEQHQVTKVKKVKEAPEIESHQSAIDETLFKKIS